MSNTFPSSIDLFVDPMEENPVVRPFGRHPFVATAAVVGILVTLGWVCSLSGMAEWTLSAVSFLMVTVPCIVLLTCYSKQSALLWEASRWEKHFMTALRLELGKAVMLENRTEFLISVMKGHPVDAVLRNGRFTTAYTVVVHEDEVVMFSDEGIDRDWKSMDASKDHWYWR